MLNKNLLKTLTPIAFAMFPSFLLAMPTAFTDRLQYSLNQNSSTNTEENNVHGGNMTINNDNKTNETKNTANSEYQETPWSLIVFGDDNNK